MSGGMSPSSLPWGAAELVQAPPILEELGASNQVWVQAQEAFVSPAPFSLPPCLFFDRLKLEIVPVYPLKMEPKMLSAAMTLRIMRKRR